MICSTRAFTRHEHLNELEAVQCRLHHHNCPHVLGPTGIHETTKVISGRGEGGLERQLDSENRDGEPKWIDACGGGILKCSPELASNPVQASHDHEHEVTGSIGIDSKCCYQVAS